MRQGVSAPPELLQCSFFKGFPFPSRGLSISYIGFFISAFMGDVGWEQKTSPPRPGEEGHYFSS